MSEYKPIEIHQYTLGAFRKMLQRFSRQGHGACPVVFDNDVPVWRVGSWRGDYMYPTLYHGWVNAQGESKTTSTVDSLLQDCNEVLDGRLLQGYKGGDFTMAADDVLYADDNGDYEGYFVMDVHLDSSTISVVVVRGIKKLLESDVINAD